jgi:hypothetical protein
MNDSDFAIVVGISRYPGFGVTSTDASNLEAPVRDANDVYEWLVSPLGGDLPRANVKLICSNEGAAPVSVLNVDPKLQEIQDAFYELVLRAEQNEAAGNRFQVGRRLYIYMSGHGFSPSMFTGCLFTANATRFNVPNVYASGRLQWFQDAGCFEEYILWLDCCMDRLVTVEPEAISLLPLGTPRPAVPTMVAFAATRGLRTLETTIDDALHSVFTYALLKGLNGAAVDTTSGAVTGRSLGDYLLNAMKKWIPAAEMNNPLISKEPSIVKADEALILVAPSPAGLVPPRYTVTIHFPDTPPPARARLWSGSPPRAEAVDIVDGVVTRDCPRGLYIVEVPDQGLRMGFEVTGTGPVDVTVALADHDAPIREAPADGSCILDINLGGAFEIFVLDADFRLVGRGRGGLLNEKRPFGIYKIKTRLGRELREKIIFLDGCDPIRLDDLPQPDAPVLLTKDAVPAEESFWQIHVRAGDGAEILIVIRDDPSLAGSADLNLAEYGTRLLDGRGRVIADLDIHGVRRRQGKDNAGNDDATSFATCRIALTPGTYSLQRQLLEGTVQEQTILALDGWRTELHEFRSMVSLGTRQDISHQQVMVMFDQLAPVSDALGRHYAELIEAATVALADNRKILAGELYDRLVTNFTDPIAGLLGGHLLLIEAESDPQFDAARGLPALDAVVTRLRALVHGAQHPDIEALSQRCVDRTLRGTTPLQYPPLYARSWKLAVDESHQAGSLVPAELWGRVHATLPTAPYFAWAADDRSREAHADGLLAQALEVMKVGLSHTGRRPTAAANASTPTPTPTSMPVFAPVPARDPVAGGAALPTSAPTPAFKLVDAISVIPTPASIPRSEPMAGDAMIVSSTPMPAFGAGAAFEPMPAFEPGIAYEPAAAYEPGAAFEPGGAGEIMSSPLAVGAAQTPTTGPSADDLISTLARQWRIPTAALDGLLAQKAPDVLGPRRGKLP